VGYLWCCHICGQILDDLNFQADHIVPHSTGGDCNADNYLPSCDFCNNYRWNYLPDEIKWILKIGVWARTQIEFETQTGKILSAYFIEYEKTREQRRKEPRVGLLLDIEQYPVREKIDYVDKQMKFKKN
jgi:hypothetical protein